MGCKRVKEYFGIQHIVHIKNGLVHIGSPFISKILSFNFDGELVDGSTNKKEPTFLAYCNAIESDKDKFKQLLEQEDENAATTPVFSIANDDKTVIEDHCEQLGWPNITLSGTLMFDNVHFATQKEAIEHGVLNINAGIKHYKRTIQDLEERLASEKDELQKSQDALSVLSTLLNQQ